jgi:hypothetical protein
LFHCFLILRKSCMEACFEWQFPGSIWSSLQPSIFKINHNPCTECPRKAKTISCISVVYILEIGDPSYPSSGVFVINLSRDDNEIFQIVSEQFIRSQSDRCDTWLNQESRPRVFNVRGVRLFARTPFLDIQLRFQSPQFSPSLQCITSSDGKSNCRVRWTSIQWNTHCNIRPSWHYITISWIWHLTSFRLFQP